jgi:hypothetical protein
MLSTGDVQNYLRKLQTELRFIKFRDVDYKSLVNLFFLSIYFIFSLVLIDFKQVIHVNY